MRKQARGINENWYSPIVDSVKIYIPGNPIYKTMRARNARLGTLFILPFIIGFLLFMVRPLIESFYMSLCEVDVVPGTGYIAEFRGLSQYKEALGIDPNFNQLLVEEIGRMCINTLATLVLSFVIAVILNQEFKGRTLFRAIFFLPVILSSGVLPGIESQNEFFNMMTTMNSEMAEAAGINISESLQQLLSVSGVAPGVFNVIFSMIDAIYDIVMASGIQIVVFLTGLQGISPSLYEAANVEGCTAWESFWKITFPMVSPLLLVNCIYTIIDFFMKNDNKVMEHINAVQSRLDYGLSSAMSWIYFGVAVVFIAICTLIISLGVHYYED